MTKPARPDPDERSQQVELVLQQIEQLPTLSPIAQRVLRLGSAADADLTDVVRVIQSDPSLTGRVLSMCQRAELGLGDRVTTVERAVVMLGFEAIRAAILSVAVYDAMSAYAGQLEERPEAETFRHNAFWRHCVASASAADEIARTHPKLGVSPDEAFVGGLLHDVGKLALDLVLPRTYGKIMRLAEERGLAASDAANRVIGINHHTAGKRLAEHWNLPLEIQDSMWLYGHPPEAMGELRNRSLVGIVGAAHRLSRALHVGWSGEFDSVPQLDSIASIYGLERAKLERIGAGLHEAVAARCADLGLDGPHSPGLLLESISQANAWLGRANGRLEKQADLAGRCDRSLRAISGFLADQPGGKGLTSTVAAAGRSASEAFGATRLAVLIKRSPADPWRLDWLSSRGETSRAASLTEPAGADRVTQALIEIGRSLDAPLSLTPLESWLGGSLAGRLGAADAIRVLPLTPGRINDAPAIALLHDGIEADEQHRALIDVWASSVAAAARHESARRLGERLAEANRALSAAQDRLSEAQAMARLGELAAGAAHEMNNPLTVISGRAQLLHDSAGDESIRSAAGAIVGASQLLSELISALHMFADPPKPIAKPADVQGLTRTVARSVRDRMGSGLDLSIDAAGAPKQAMLDEGLVQRILTELLVNAAETGAPATLCVRIDPLDECLVFEVADRGPGLSERALRHAFDPFFSDKPAGRQPGLGLARARRLAELMNGTLTIANGRDLGAVATLSLPSSMPSNSIPNRDFGTSQHPEVVG
ncbi:MAG: HDOD domain-containing protein [Phycisphaerales bacterium]|jgi:putative nucleotidyltransferase with HDIG domain